MNFPANITEQYHEGMMDILSALPFIPGEITEKVYPLARYLPPLPEGVAQKFVQEHIQPGDWVLDPFGSSPQIAVEMARAGCRVLVAVNNPITRLLLEIAANPPSLYELRAALTELADAHKGEERLESHLMELYSTNCVRCQRSLSVQAFIWDRNQDVPIGRIYHCPCGESGVYPTTEADKEYAAQIAATTSLHRSRALERIISLDDPSRTHAQEALSCYLPRSIYALITIINILDRMVYTPQRKRALYSLILSTFDEANTLWPHPAERPRPKQLTTPPRFLEKNIWLALEGAIESWVDDETPISITFWPKLPENMRGICIFEGPVRNLTPQMKDIKPEAVVTAFPRPNQAYWTLSALWAGWLAGPQSIKPFKSVLHRRRYDWSWHASALYAVLKNISSHVPLNAPLFALVAEPEPSFLTAALLAASEAGFDLHGLALRTRHDPVQILWYRRAFVRASKKKINVRSIRRTMLDYLCERGEPVTYIHLHAVGLADMAKDHTLLWREDALTQINTPIQKSLTAPFHHYGGSANLETSLWGLETWNDKKNTLADRTEAAAICYLQKNTICTPNEFERNINAELSGFFTPPLGLLREILSSYALLSDGEWHLRSEDDPVSRQTDLLFMEKTLENLGQRIDYQSSWIETPHHALIWRGNKGVSYVFYLLCSAIIGRIICNNPYPPEYSILVIPGSRIGLLINKFDRDATLQAIWKNGWRVLKFRQLRRIAGITSLTSEHWEKELSSDPIEPPEQMRLL